MKKLLFVFLFLLPVTAFADAFDDAVAKYESDVKNATNILNSKITQNTNLVQLSTDQVNDDMKSTVRTAKKKFNKQLSSQEKEDEQKYQEKQQEVSEQTDVSNSANSSNVTNPDKIAELEANAKAMKDKENSTANKMLGAAAVGATGIGGSQLLQGLSEKKSDDAAERDMKAYLATFKCDYGQGQNVNGGDKSITLPGGNVLTSYYTEYKTLAANLKTTKTALGLTPGIESETLLDKSTAGLYDNESTGKKSGAFASVSDALSGNADAKDAWNAQKSEASKKVTTGIVAAGVGIVGGAVGNMLINKDSTKESSDVNSDDKKTNDTSSSVTSSDKSNEQKISSVTNDNVSLDNTDKKTNTFEDLDKKYKDAAIKFKEADELYNKLANESMKNGGVVTEELEDARIARDQAEKDLETAKSETVTANSSMKEIQTGNNTSDDISKLSNNSSTLSLRGMK